MKKRLIKLIHIGKTSLCWTDEVYRDVLYRITGRASSTACNIDELEKVLSHMKTQGFIPTAKGYGRLPNVSEGKKKTLSKIKALLTSAGRSWDYAEAMSLKMFKQSVIEWLSYTELTKLMQALIIDAKRRGGS